MTTAAGHQVALRAPLMLADVAVQLACTQAGAARRREGWHSGAAAPGV